MSAQTFNSLQESIAIALTQTGNQGVTLAPNFSAQLPMAISWAEDGIYRAVPMLASRMTYGLNPGTVVASREVSLGPIAPVLVVEEFQVVVGSFITDDLGNPITDDKGIPISGDQGPPTMVPYDMVTLDFILRVWPVQSQVIAPSLAWQGGRYFAMKDHQTIAMAPTPDAGYLVQVTGLFQPAPLTVNNNVSYLSTVYPDALIAGACVFLTGALTRNFGAQMDEPRSAISWQQQWDRWLVIIRDEERRRRGLAQNFPQPPQPEMRRQAQ